MSKHFVESGKVGAAFRICARFNKTHLFLPETHPVFYGKVVIPSADSIDIFLEKNVHGIQLESGQTAESGSPLIDAAIIEGYP
jgi:hypothetical protein